MGRYLTITAQWAVLFGMVGLGMWNARSQTKVDLAHQSTGSRSQVTCPTTANCIMNPGAVLASGGTTVYATSATLTVTGGMDSGPFTFGYNSGGQRVCFYGNGINPANYVTSGFAGDDLSGTGFHCTTPAPATVSGFTAVATVEITSGQAALLQDFRADTVVWP